VVTPIAKNVDNRGANLAWRAQDPRVVPVSPDWPAKCVHAIEPTSHPNREAAKTARQRDLTLCFANEVYVVGLNAVVDHSAAKTVTGSRDRGDEDASRIAEPQ
jgi:hypothetical protein